MFIVLERNRRLLVGPAEVGRRLRQFIKKRKKELKERSLKELKLYREHHVVLCVMNI